MSNNAAVVFYDRLNDIIEVEVGEHRMESGGQADGFCYVHQSFDCKLTADEWADWEEAELAYFGGWA